MKYQWFMQNDDPFPHQNIQFLIRITVLLSIGLSYSVAAVYAMTVGVPETSVLFFLP